MKLAYILLSVWTAASAASKEPGQLSSSFNFEVRVLISPLRKAGELLCRKSKLTAKFLYRRMALIESSRKTKTPTRKLL